MVEKNMNHYLERTKRNHFWTGGTVGQSKLRELKIGVAGLGGMGSNIAEILVRTGITKLKIADPDVIELANFNRQVIANLDTLGKRKTDASTSELFRIDTNLDIQVFTEGITKDNADEFVKDLDILINEIDVLHIDVQLHLLNAARRYGVPVYTTLVVGLGVHLYKYSPTGDYTAEKFLGHLLNNPTIENLIKTLGEPLPSYLAEKLDQFKEEIKVNGGIPIFGASTYLGQSLLVIRALFDLGCLDNNLKTASTPSLPEFLVLDPLTLEFKTALIGDDGKARFKT